MKERSRIACTVLISLLTFAAVAQESNLNGRWTATLKKGDRTGTAILTVSVSGREVTGTLSDPSGQIWQLQNGNLEGSRLTFEVTAREHGGSKNIHFFGQVEGDSITMHNESNSRPGQTMSFHKIRD
jgi:hypothetical protein